jgi:hypothetical protein
MNNPDIQFPYANKTDDGHVVYAGVASHENGYLVIAFCPTKTSGDGKVRATYSFSDNYDTAVNMAQDEAHTWYNSDLGAVAA